MNDIKFSRYLSYILRHNPTCEGLKLDEEGYCDVELLLEAAKKKYKDVTFEDIQRIVNTDDKKRYSFNGDKSMIRANQGHSVLKLKFEKIAPPDILYHGTATRFLPSINEKGIIKGTRHHVHLSKDIETASKVGKRHGELAVLKVDAKKMHMDGIAFYISENGVYLCDYVSPKYIELLK